MKPSFDFVEVAAVRWGWDISHSALKGQVDYSLLRRWVWECYSQTIKYWLFELAFTQRCDNGGSLTTWREACPSVTLKHAPKFSGGVLYLTKTFTALRKVWSRPLPSVFTPFDMCVCVCVYVQSEPPPLGMMWCGGHARHPLGKRALETDAF